MRVGSIGASDDEWAECAGAGKRQMGMRQMAMREAVELLARGWPEDYPAGAVERVLLQPSGTEGAAGSERHRL